MKQNTNKEHKKTSLLIFPLKVIFWTALISPAFNSSALSKEEQMERKNDFHRIHNQNIQRALRKKQQKIHFLKQVQKAKTQKEKLQKITAFQKRKKQRTAEKERQMKIWLQSFLKPKPSAGKFNLKKAFLKKKKQEQKLQTQYKTPLDLHLFSKPLPVYKKRSAF